MTACMLSSNAAYVVRVVHHAFFVKINSHCSTAVKTTTAIMALLSLSLVFIEFVFALLPFVSSLANLLFVLSL